MCVMTFKSNKQPQGYQQMVSRWFQFIEFRYDAIHFLRSISLLYSKLNVHSNSLMNSFTSVIGSDNTMNNFKLY